jgi:hypothetical protein
MPSDGGAAVSEMEPFRVNFWCELDGNCVRATEETATHIEILQLQSPYELAHRFKYPEERYKAEKLQRALQWAAEHGARSRAREIRESLRKLIGV